MTALQAVKMARAKAILLSEMTYVVLDIFAEGNYPCYRLGIAEDAVCRVYPGGRVEALTPQFAEIVKQEAARP